MSGTSVAANVPFAFSRRAAFNGSPPVRATMSALALPSSSPSTSSNLLAVECMPLALCCDDPCEVRWREDFARSRAQALVWGNPSSLQAGSTGAREAVD